jgi:hypothetical protein
MQSEISEMDSDRRKVGTNYAGKLKRTIFGAIFEDFFFFKSKGKDRPG